jgi:hypothetical protein
MKKTREKAGLKYTDGTPVCLGDTYEMTQESETIRGGQKFIRKVYWEDAMAAYVNDRGYPLHDDFQDVNTIKIVKIK